MIYSLRHGACDVGRKSLLLLEDYLQHPPNPEAEQKAAELEVVFCPSLPAISQVAAPAPSAAGTAGMVSTRHGPQLWLSPKFHPTASWWQRRNLSLWPTLRQQTHSYHIWHVTQQDMDFNFSALEGKKPMFFV